MTMQDFLSKLSLVSKFWKLYTVVLTPLLFSLIFLFSTSKQTRCGYVIMVMAEYWMSEALPLPITALIPVFAFPVFGVLSSTEVSLMYMKETNMLFLGGLMVATAVEHSNLHKRIALFVILHVGQSPRRLMAGFMLTSMFLSMWISNTASTAMMVPIVDAILEELYKTTHSKELETTSEQDFGPHKMEDGALESKASRRKSVDNEKKPHLTGKDNLGMDFSEEDFEQTIEKAEVKVYSKEYKSLRNMYFLSVAYSANIGGTGSLTGTGPNLIVKGVLDSSFDSPTGLNFASWMAFNVPGMILCTIIGWLWLQFMFIGFGSSSKLAKMSHEKRVKVRNLIEKQYKGLGKITFHESAVLSVFIMLVLLWLFREPGFMIGWADVFKWIFGEHFKIGDGPPALFAAFLLFVIPSKFNFWPSSKYDGPSPSCLTWKVIQEKTPWGIIILLGGGFAMAKACNDSGLSQFIGEQLKVLDSLPVSLTVVILSVSTAVATEVASNTATASIIMPILKELALKMCVNPLYLMLPAAVCCSYAFMLPVATPPNAIVFGAAQMNTKIMMRSGFVMNLLCVCVINFMINTLGVQMFDVSTLPPWVNSSTGDVVPHCEMINNTLLLP